MRDELGGPAEEMGGAADPQPPPLRLDPGGDSDQGARPLDRRPRGDRRPEGGQGVVRGFGVGALEARVEEIPHGAEDPRIAVDQPLEAADEGRLLAGGALGQHLEEEGTFGDRLARPLEDLGGDREEGLEADPGERPAPPRHEERREMGGEAPRRHDDPHRPGEEPRLAGGLGQVLLQAFEEERLGRPGPVDHPDSGPRWRCWGRRRGRFRGPEVEERQLRRHGPKDS